jgi:hypothetical protein
VVVTSVVSLIKRKGLAEGVRNLLEFVFFVRSAENRVLGEMNLVKCAFNFGKVIKSPQWFNSERMVFRRACTKERLFVVSDSAHFLVDAVYKFAEAALFIV